MSNKTALGNQRKKSDLSSEKQQKPTISIDNSDASCSPVRVPHPHDALDSINLVVALRECQNLHVHTATSVTNSKKRIHPPLSAQFSRLLPYPRGMFNSKNFCFMNAVIQALIFIPPLTQLAISVEDAGYRELCPTLSALGKWLREYWKPKSSILPPALPLHKQVDFSGNIQSDAQEYLQRLLECIDKELMALEEEELAGDNVESLQQAMTAKANDMKGWTVVHHGKQKLTYQVHKAKHSLLLSYLFGGLTESHVSGTVRDRTSVTVESFFTLSLKIGFKSVCTIEEALQYTFQSEKIEMNHASLGTKTIKKANILVELPEILILHLSRWAVTAEGEVVKLDNTVKYRSTLTIPASICPDRLANQPKQRTYRLLSVVAHRGNTAHGGHYVTYLSGSSGNVANPFCMTPAKSASKIPGASLHVDPSRKKSGGSDHTSLNHNKFSLPPRSALPNGSFLLCNDVKITLENESDLLKETAYFLVYQKEH